MNILVIGNGFDLAHYLPTQYSDFLDFVKAVNGSPDDRFSKFINELQTRKVELYKEVNTLISGNVLIEYFLSIYSDRCQNGKNGWIDFESEISVIVQKLDEAKQSIVEKANGSKEAVKLDKKYYEHLQFLMGEYRAETGRFEPRFFDHLAEVLLDSLNSLISLLEIYLYEYVEQLDCAYRIDDLKDKGIDHVLSFNYTNTYRKLYDSIGSAKYSFIHGEARNHGNCNLVLGIDEYLSSERIDSDNQFVWFKKFYQRIFKETSSEYLDWIHHFESFNEAYKKSKPSHMNIYIYGHSLDVTDKDVLSRLIMMENTTTYIFYHNKEALAKQISNLVKIIGEENLIEKTGGKDRTIKFIQSKPAEEVTDE